ncbi:MAG: hypothetical protein RL490_941, partial [Pseudomonadota bacterium]
MLNSQNKTGLRVIEGGLRRMRIGISLTGLMLAGTAITAVPVGANDLNGVNATVGALPDAVYTNTNGTATLSVNPGALGIIYGGRLTDGASGGGAGVLALSKLGANTLTLTGTLNNFTGNTNVGNGTLAAGAAFAFSANSQLNITGTGSVNLAGFNQMIKGLSGNTSNGVTSASAATLTSNTSASTSYAGTISGAIRFVKQGAGIQTLGGNNSYSGGTELQGGGFIYNNGNAFGSGNITVNGLSTLSPGSAGHTVANNIVLNQPLFVNVGGFASGLTGEISGGSSLNKNGNA